MFITEDYHIEDNTITSLGKITEIYNSIECLELPSEIYKLATGDLSYIKKFIRAYGNFRREPKTMDIDVIIHEANELKKFLDNLYALTQETLSPMQKARLTAEISKQTNKYLPGIRVRSDAENEILKVNFIPQNLFSAAYFIALLHLVEDGRFERCKLCNVTFLQFDNRQQYCPKRRNLGESACGAKKRRAENG